MPGNGKRCLRVRRAAFHGLLGPGGGVIDGGSAVQSFLKIYGKFANIMQFGCEFGFFLCTERCGKLPGQFCCARKMLGYSLSAGTILADVGKCFHRIFLHVTAGFLTPSLIAEMNIASNLFFTPFT